MYNNDTWEVPTYWLDQNGYIVTCHSCNRITWLRWQIPVHGTICVPCLTSNIYRPPTRI